MRQIRVLVVDDSAYLRKMFTHMLRQSPHIQVVGAARDGAEALLLVEELKPDVVTLDLHLPGLNGLEFLSRQRKLGALAVVVVSIETPDSPLAAEAAQLGAADFLSKPTGWACDRVLEMQEELIAKVLSAAPVDSRVDAVVIGMSTGGPQALRYLLDRFPGDMPVPLAVVLHMPVGYTGPFARTLDEAYAVEVCEARTGMAMQPGRMILGRAGRQFQLCRHLDRVVCAVETEGTQQPSADLLFQSAAELYGPRLLAVVMTGMGKDGTAGAARVKANGGRVWVESEPSCVVYGMPRSVMDAGLADDCLPLEDIPQAILNAL